jgi:hypothetical protein
VQVRPYVPSDREAVQTLGHRLTEGVAPWRDRRITLETGAANIGARSFYASLGYDEEQVQLTRRCDLA